MPLIRIENYPNIAGYPNVRGLAAALQSACATAEVPGIDSVKKVTVVAGGAQLIETDKTLMVLVEGLFDWPERTKEVRDRLANRLARHAKMNLPPDWKVEVLVKRFSPEKDSYVELGPDQQTQPSIAQSLDWEAARTEYIATCERLTTEQQEVRVAMQRLGSAGAERLMLDDFPKVLQEGERMIAKAQAAIDALQFLAGSIDAAAPELKKRLDRLANPEAVAKQIKQELERIKLITPVGWINTTVAGSVASRFEHAAPSDWPVWEPVLEAIGLRMLPVSDLVGRELRYVADLVYRVEVVRGAPTGRDASVVAVRTPCLVHAADGRPFRKARVAAGGP